MYKSIVLIVIVCIIISGCNKTKNSSKEIIAKVNNDLIYSEDIIQETYRKIYSIKKNAIDNLIKEKVLDLEAKKKNVTIDSLKMILTLQANKKAIAQIKENNLNLNNKYNEYRNKNFQLMIDSLVDLYNVKSYLVPKYYRKIQTSDLYSVRLNKKESKNKVYIISDYNCFACKKSHKHLSKIIDKYNDRISFHFIYFSDYIEKGFNAVLAAKKQGIGLQLFDFLFKQHGNIPEEKFIQFANEMDLDVSKFKEDFQNKKADAALLKTKVKLIERGIYKTPTFIVNQKVIDYKDPIQLLENTIYQELYEEN